MLFPCSHNCGHPSFWKSQWIFTESINHLLILFLVLMMDSCFGTCFHSSFPENLQCHLVNLCLTFSFSGIMSLRYPDTNQNWISVRYDGWNIYPRVISLVFIWPGKVMSCLAYLVGGPIVIVSLLTRLSILTWGNCKTYSTSCSWWILRVSRVWPLLEDHVNATSKHVSGTPIFNKNIGRTMLKFPYRWFFSIVLIKSNRHFSLSIGLFKPFLWSIWYKQ